MANWTDSEKLMIWKKGTVIPGLDPSIWRLDQCGALMNWNMYGDRSDRTNYGWEIDHIKPESKDGPTIVSNARPLQWFNNASRQNGRLTCPITWQPESEDDE